MSVLVEASHPSIPGANVREGLLLRGALIERERIVALIEDAKRGLKFGDDRALVDNMIALIQGEAK